MRYSQYDDQLLTRPSAPPISIRVRIFNYRELYVYYEEKRKFEGQSILIYLILY